VAHHHPLAPRRRLTTVAAPERRPSGPPSLEVRKGRSIIDAAMQSWAPNLRVLVPAAAAVLLPFNLVSARVTRLVTPSALDTFADYQKAVGEGKEATLDLTGGQIGAAVAGAAIQYVGTVVLTAAVAVLVCNQLAGRTPDRRVLWSAARRRGPVALATMLLGTAAVIAAVALFSFVAGMLGTGGALAVVLTIVSIPVAVLTVTAMLGLTVSAPLVAVEGGGPVRALRRTVALLRGRPGRVALLAFVALLVTELPRAILGSLTTELLDALGGHNRGFAFVWEAVGQTAGGAVFGTLAAAVTTWLYLDQRMRHEQIDRQVLADSPGLGSDRPDDAAR